MSVVPNNVQSKACSQEIAVDGEMTVLNRALLYASNGWPVFPCNPADKTPRTKTGFKAATTDPQTIRNWWAAMPGSMIGVPTGPASGFWVLDLDVDPTKGVDGIAEVERLGLLPDTVESTTPRGGRHAFFRWDPDHPIGCSVGTGSSGIAAGVDVRGEGGYVIMPGSTRADGSRYSWFNPPGLFEIAEAPSWLLDATTRRHHNFPAVPAVQPKSGLPPITSSYGQAALREECIVVANAPSGSRNHTLNTSAFCLGQLVGGGELDEGNAIAGLREAAQHLAQDDGAASVIKTIRSGLRAGIAKPRTRPVDKTHGAASRAPVPLSQPVCARDSGTPAELVIDTLEGFAELSLPPRQHLLVPILPLRGLAMLYAARGIGKTHVGLGIAYAVATGGQFLRWTAPKARKVLLLDGEMPAELFQERIRTLMAGADSLPVKPENFRVLAMDRQELGTSLNLAKPEDQARVEAQLDGVELLVIDNISTLVSGGRENDAESWDSMQPWLLHLRRRGVSVLLIAHAGRGENARGTSKREDVLDTVIQLKRPDDYDPAEGARFQVHLTKGRGVFGDAAVAFEARLDTSTGRDIWTHSPLKDLEADKIVELTKNGLSVREIADELGISKSSVQRQQAKLREHGDL